MFNQSYPMPREQGFVNIPTAIVYSILTCGIYNLFWLYKQFQTVNAFLGRQEANFGTWFLLTLVTCGLYHIYYEYRFAQLIQEVQARCEKPVNQNLPLISLLVTIFGLPIVADAIQQNEINNLYM